MIKKNFALFVFLLFIGCGCNAMNQASRANIMMRGVEGELKIRFAKKGMGWFFGEETKLFTGAFDPCYFKKGLSDIHSEILWAQAFMGLDFRIRFEAMPIEERSALLTQVHVGTVDALLELASAGCDEVFAEILKEYFPKSDGGSEEK